MTTHISPRVPLSSDSFQAVLQQFKSNSSFFFLRNLFPIVKSYGKISLNVASVNITLCISLDLLAFGVPFRHRVRKIKSCLHKHYMPV